MPASAVEQAMPFAPALVEDLVVKSARCCCLCRQFKGQKIEVHHIKQGGPDTEDNAIPLCFDCHADVQAYNDQHPRGRKYRPGELLRLRNEWFKLVADGKAGGQLPAIPKDEDGELIRFYSQCLDRPAFQDAIRDEGSMEDFDKAVEDTITAINTGCLRARDGQVLATAKGKSNLSNSAWRTTMDAVVDLLRALRSRYALGVETGQIHLGGQNGQSADRFYCFHDHQLADWFDSTRAEMIRAFNAVAAEAGIAALRFPRGDWRRW